LHHGEDPVGEKVCVFLSDASVDMAGGEERDNVPLVDNGEEMVGVKSCVEVLVEFFASDAG
jgi:hypothetical protein